MTLSPREQGVLWDAEEHFWTSGADNARATTATNAVMAGRRITRRRDIAILTYLASAEKPDVPVFNALCASTYLNDEDRWVRFSH